VAGNVEDAAPARPDVRVFNGSQESVYGPGGKLLNSPELRAKNERARQMLAKKMIANGGAALPR
jgi:hypothetical protein